MALADDASTVLEQWILDVSNLAPELNHLLEEIEAKDKIAQECRNIITSRDTSLQRHVKSNGAGAVNPKEEQYVKTTLANFDRAQAIQIEKCTLSDRAAILLDRHIKRLDYQIRQLETSGTLPPDPLLPSLLNNNNAARIPGMPGGASTPLSAINGNAAAGTAGPSTTIANSAIARLVTNGIGGGSGRGGSPVGTPTSATSQGRAARESSIDATKRRRLNLPNAASNLRQSSAGPGTPKAGTPQPTGRAGSVPRGTNKKDTKTTKHLAPPKGGQVNPAAKRKKKGGSRKKGGVSDADDSAMSAAGDESGSERLSTVGDKGKDGQMDRDADMGGMEEEEDDGGDTSLYCTCRSVSYGNMVACDNEDCPYEWFHWGCVGLKQEPAGSWHCEECSIKLGLKK